MKISSSPDRSLSLSLHTKNAHRCDLYIRFFQILSDSSQGRCMNWIDHFHSKKSGLRLQHSTEHQLVNKEHAHIDTPHQLPVKASIARKHIDRNWFLAGSKPKKLEGNGEETGYFSYCAVSSNLFLFQSNEMTDGPITTKHYFIALIMKNT